MLIDGGNVADSSLVVSYLADQGVDSLDYVVCTHAHEDHVGGLSGPLSQYPAEHVLAPVTEYDTKAFENFLKYTRAAGAGGHVSLSRGYLDRGGRLGDGAGSAEGI